MAVEVVLMAEVVMVAELDELLTIAEVDDAVVVAPELVSEVTEGSDVAS